MIITHKMTLALDSRDSVQAIDGVQGDTARALEISLRQQDAAWAVPEGTTAMIHYRRVQGGAGGTYDTMPDGSAAYTISEDKVTVYLTPQIFSVPGPVELQVTLLCDGAEVTSFAVMVYVQGNLTDATMDEEDYVNLSTHIHGLVAAAMKEMEPSGVFVGAEEPEDPNVELWVDTDEESSGSQTGDSAAQGEVWETILDLTVTEEVERISIESDMTGNAFALSEAQIEVSICSTESNTADAALRVRTNYDNNANGGTNSTATRMFRSSGGPFECAYWLFGRGSRIMGQIYNCGNVAEAVMGYYSSAEADGMASFYFSGGVFGVGSRIVIKGVRK